MRATVPKPIPEPKSPKTGLTRRETKNGSQLKFSAPTRHAGTRKKGAGSKLLRAMRLLRQRAQTRGARRSDISHDGATHRQRGIAVTGYSLLHETRGPREPPRLAWLLAAALGVVVILPDFNWRHDVLEWGKNIVGQFDNAQAANVPAATGAAPRLAVKVDGNNRCRVRLTLNSRGPFNFVVDTGASELTLTKSQAEQLGFNLKRLPLDHTSTGWGGGKVRGVHVHLRDVRLKDFVLRDFEAAAEMESGDEGLLGITFLQRLGKFEVADGECRFWW